MIEYSDMSYITPNTKFSFDLRSLLQQFLTTEEIEMWKSGEHDQELAGNLYLHVSENGTNFDDPYIDLYNEGAFLAADGETVIVIDNDGQNVITLCEENSSQPFEMAYCDAYSCLNPIS